MGLKTFTNTRYLSEAANDFKRNKGVYCKAPPGSNEFRQYWAEQKKRSKYGYSVGDIKITGRHYFYLNFCPIKRTEKRKEGSWNVMKAKELMFPAFWEIDYNWWWAKEISMFGMLKEEVQILGIDGLPIKDYTEGKNLSCLKTRRAGFSYKEAADGVWNYIFVPESKSYYFASKDDYLTKDGILNKVTSYLEHLNTNTSDYWRRNRMVKDTMMHRRASYLDRNKDEHGFKSEILGVIIDDPDKVRGKDGIKITYEEAGSFRNLKSALAISVPSVRDGSSMTGQISVFGTGGEEGPDIEGLEDIFLEPEAYDMLEFQNIWEEGQEDTVCGYFVPCTHANQDCMDEDGNVDVEAALAFDEARRNKKRKLKDPKQLDKVVAEFPRTPSEALNRIMSNIFPVAEAQAVLRKIEKNTDIQSSILHGILWQGEKQVEFRPSSAAIPILQFPHKATSKEGEDEADLTGCVTIYTPPDRDFSGRVLMGKYIAVVDPYYKDQAQDRTSLWSVHIIKQPAMGDPYGDTIVAEYTGRPASLKTCYRNTVLLAKLYNCNIQCEIAGGGQGFFDYLRAEKLIHMACFEPELFSTKENGANPRNRNYFMNTSTGDKITGLTYFSDWLLKQRGINKDGQPVLNIHMIKSAGLLREIIKFNPDPKKNFDRISSMCIGMFMLREAEIFKSAPNAPMPEFYNRTLTGGQGPSEYSDSEYMSLDDMLVGD